MVSGGSSEKVPGGAVWQGVARCAVVRSCVVRMVWYGVVSCGWSVRFVLYLLPGVSLSFESGEFWQRVFIFFIFMLVWFALN